MTTQTLQEHLLYGLTLVGRAVPKHTSLPILGTIYFTIEDNQLRLAATNLELAIAHRIAVQPNGDGNWALAVPAANLVDLVKTLPPETVHLQPGEDQLALTCGSAQAQFQTFDAADFPTLADPDTAETVTTLRAGDLARALRHVTLASSDDASHTVLSGIRLRVDHNTLILDAADGFRLAQYHAPIGDCIKESTLIVPGSALAELCRILTKVDPEMDVTLSTTHAGNRVHIHLGDTLVSAALVDGNYPDLDRIIPEAYTTRAIVTRTTLLQAVDRARIFARDHGKLVKLAVDPGAMFALVVAAEADAGGQGETQLTATVKGDALELYCNVDFLREQLKAMDVANVVLDFEHPLKPFALYGEDDATFKSVIMPMHTGRQQADGETSV